ncbi:MAG TPA: DNA ligase D, partial [Alphaproteobacteria bacterium]|nr:DNA ligase D [Alphaproteobacteria bacterium]
MEEIAAGASKVWHSNTSVKENVARLEAESPQPSGKRGGKMPRFVEPELATLVDEAPVGSKWLHEIKYDGYRAITSIANSKAVIYTRKGLDWTARFGPIGPAVAALPVKSAQIDGEIAVADKNGKTNFSALQAALADGTTSNLTYYVFDLLELDGKDLRKEPLSKRKELLKKLIQKLKKPSHVIFSDGVVGEGAKTFEGACRLGLEGIVSKRLDAPYRSVRTKEWLKVKCGMGQEFVIIGWQPSDVRGRPFSSLLMGVREGGKLRYAGRVGSGFDEKTLNEVSALLKPREVKTPPVDALPPEAKRGTHYVKPELVAEVAFRGWSSDNLIRQGSFKGVRTDKPAKEVTQERRSSIRMIESETRGSHGIEIEGVRITHPDDRIFAGEAITKRDLIDHYVAFAEPMLRHLARRPLSLVRFPDKEATKGFFQKHASPGFPDAFKKIAIKEKSALEDFLYIDNVAGLVAAAQVRAIELHIWGSHIDTLEEPDRIVFDFDPDPEVEWSAVQEAAKEMRERLDAIGLQSFLMATGGKGLHVIAPLKPRHSWPEIKMFTHALAGVMAQESPKKYTTILSKANRRGRIFIDYLRNERSATAVAPYSPRAHKGAPIATPLAWAALPKLESAQPVTIKTASAKLKNDPWPDYFKVKQVLPLEKLTKSRS